MRPALLAAAATIALHASPPAAGAAYRPPLRDLPFPVYTNAPIGRQLTGQHVPASTPALSPGDAQRQFTLPEGFEIRLFASEPEVVNPVAMTWDERGRLWVVELYEYPLGAKPGEKPRDRIKILEDTDADGKADKVHVWADGLNLATGLVLGHGGAYVGQAPHLLFLRDTDGDDRADRTEIVKTGFGLEDRHELLNGFTWGPDGQLYMTHGVFTRSKVVSPEGGTGTGEPVLLTAGVARLHPRTRRFEVYAEGTSNPWGVDFDRTGNAFVSACVIEHLFHLVPGGIYDRQAGQAPHPYAYETLHAINDHKHHMAAYAGIQVYQGNQFPADNSGTILQGNIHDNAVHQDRLQPNGSTFVASHWRDLVRANDGWFMPVSTQIGPDGAVWIMDWYDRYPCYQNANADPAGVDREHGRIWRVVHTGTEKGRPVPTRPSRDMDLARLSSEELVALLAHPNVWQRRTAQRLIAERRDLPHANTLHDETALHRLFKDGRTLEARLAALWTLHASEGLDDTVLEAAAKDAEPALRAWSARLTGERGFLLPDAFERLHKLASDPDPTVRLAVAVAARQFTSGSLTVDTPPRIPIREVPMGGVLSALWFSSFEAKDPVIPFMIWMAVEPIVAFDPLHALGFYEEDGGMKQMPLAGILLTKILRRTSDLGDPARLDAAVVAFGKIPEAATPVLLAGLQGLLEGQRGKTHNPSPAAREVLFRLGRHTDAAVAGAARQLATLWGDATALRDTLAIATDSGRAVPDRRQAIQAARANKTPAVRDALLAIVAQPNPDPVVVAALEALGELGGAEIADELLNRWKDLTPAARTAAAGALASRRPWALPLVSEIRAGRISPSELGPGLLRSLVDHRDETVRREARAAIGRFREAGADKAARVADRRKVVLEGEPDPAAGHEMARKTCLVCHKLHGEGESVGPDLTGVGRSSLDALLWNVIDPNQVIGAGYEQVEVETRDDRVIAGRMIENNDARVRLLLQGGKEEVIARGDVKSQRTLESSAMPEGLDQMPDTDFRNLIWFILAPPQEGPLTPQKRERLSADGGHASTPAPGVGAAVRTDRESVALWNPSWRVLAPDFEGTPSKLPEYQGRANILRTHPHPDRAPAALERSVTVDRDHPGTVRFAVAAHDQGDWMLRVRVDGRVVHERVVTAEAPRWKEVAVDLAEFAGRTVTVRLENVPTDWAWEFGYWADLELKP